MVSHIMQVTIPNCNVTCLMTVALLATGPFPIFSSVLFKHPLGDMCHDYFHSVIKSENRRTSFSLMVTCKCRHKFTNFVSTPALT